MFIWSQWCAWSSCFRRKVATAAPSFLVAKPLVPVAKCDYAPGFFEPCQLQRSRLHPGWQRIWPVKTRKLCRLREVTETSMSQNHETCVYKPVSAWSHFDHPQQLQSAAQQKGQPDHPARKLMIRPSPDMARQYYCNSRSNVNVRHSEFDRTTTKPSNSRFVKPITYRNANHPQPFNHPATTNNFFWQEISASQRYSENGTEFSFFWQLVEGY